MANDNLYVTVRAHVYVSGRVQGVFFRHSTKVKAQASGVFGWVRNLGDGRVEAVFEGEESAVKGVVKWCKKGPDGSVVDELNVKWDEEPEGLREFSVKY
ncbi:MAG: acylphosphatase [Candidatus Altiarchaeota archaeon]